MYLISIYVSTSNESHWANPLVVLFVGLFICQAQSGRAIMTYIQSFIVTIELPSFMPNYRLAHECVIMYNRGLDEVSLLHTCSPHFMVSKV